MVVAIYIPPTVQEGSVFSTSSTAFIVCRSFDDGWSDLWEVIPDCSLICISLIMSDVENLSMLLAIYLSLLEKCLFRSSIFWYFLKIIFMYIFTFGCVGSSLLLWLFYSCDEEGHSCGTQALGHAGFGSCSSRALEHRLSSCGAWA